MSAGCGLDEKMSPSDHAGGCVAGELSRPLGDPIAAGRTAEVYAWEAGWVLKLFRLDWPQRAAEHEARVARAVYALEAPAPAIGELVQINGRPGLVCERINGSSMADVILRKPWLLPHCARLLANLHADMHAHRAEGLPLQRERLEPKIRAAKALPSELRDRVLGVLQGLPDGNCLCHGDFWPGQVLMSPAGPVIVDWSDATSGHPAGDVARTSLIMLGGIRQSGLPVPLPFRFSMAWYHRIYLQHYKRLRAIGQQEIDAWWAVVAAARLSENIRGLQGWLLGQVRLGLSRFE